MTDQVHAALAFRDETAGEGHPMLWRARCTCMDGPPWRPCWSAPNLDGVLDILTRHLVDPRPDDWLNLYVGGRRRTP